MDLPDGNLGDFAANGELDGLELWEEFQELPNLSRAAKLIARVQTLDQELPFFGDHGCVHEVSAHLRDLMEDQVIPDMSWAIHMNFCVVEYLMVLLNRIECEL